MNKQLSTGTSSFSRLLRKYPILVNLLLATVSLLLSLTVMEFVLRAFIPLNRPEPALFRIPDPVMGWVLQPNANYVYTMPEATISVSYNSQGFHDVEHPVSKPDGAFRILVLGDSFVEANGVELNDTFHRQLGRLADSTGRNIEVISMGVSGYGTLQELLTFQEKGVQYEPDLVLLGFFAGNDLANNSFELESTMGTDRIYTFARPFLDQSDPTRWTITPVDFEGTQRRYERVRASLDPKNYRLQDRIILLRLARAGLRALRSPDAPTVKDGADLAEKARKEIAYLGVDYCTETPEYSRSWETTERILIKLKDEVEAHGARLVVFSIPTFEEVSLDYRKTVLANAVYPEKLCLEDAPSQTRLSELLMKLEIDFVPLLSDFREVTRDDGIELYRAGDLHLNSEGHALAAKLVISDLINWGLLPSGTQLITSTP